MQKPISSLLFVVWLLALSSSPAWAWPGGPPAKVHIKGPNIEGEVEVTRADILDGLGAEQFIDWSQSSTMAPFAVDGYELVRYYKDGDSYWALDRVRYYPNPKGGRGAILYVGGVDVNTGGGVWNGKWFNATPEGDEGMTRLFSYITSSAYSSTSNPVQPMPASTVTTKTNPLSQEKIETAAKTSDALSTLPVIIGVVGLVCLVGVFGFWLGTRKRA